MDECQTDDMSTSGKRPRSDEEKRRASEQILYEYEMMRAATLACQVTQGSPLGNACVESALIHARNLYYFFNKPGKESDIAAGDFFPPNSWEKQCPGEPEFFKDKANLNKVHRFLAHISWDRIDSAKPTWPLVEICRQLKEPLRVFASLAPTESLCARFQELAQAQDQATDIEKGESA
jgi:hypothetical protein